jgi:hypothetical protein
MTNDERRFRLHTKPVGLLNAAGFYDRLLDFLRHLTAERFLLPAHFDCLLVEADAATLIARMADFRPRQLGKWLEPDER